MVRYPSWFSELDSACIDQALAEHKAPLVTETSSNLVIFRNEYASEAASVQSVLAVFRVIVQRLQGHREHQPPQTLRSEAHRLFGDVVASAYLSRPRSTTRSIDEFATMVQAERDSQDWWRQFLETFQAPVVPNAPTSSMPELPTIDARVPLSVEETAQRLGVHKSLIYRGIKNNTIQALRIGSKVLKVPQSEVDRLLNTGKYPRSN